MDFLHWSHNLSAHNEEIDAEHQQLIDHLNELCLSLDRGEARAVVEEKFARLIEATKGHFQHEEGMMAGSDYPDIGHHRDLHIALVDEIETLQGEFLAGRMDIGQETVDFLKSWLCSHIIESDKSFGDYLRGRLSAAGG